MTNAIDYSRVSRDSLSMFANEVINTFGLRPEQALMVSIARHGSEIANPSEFVGRMAFVQLVEAGWLVVTDYTASGGYKSARINPFAGERLDGVAARIDGAS
jgi:hypothetical protein